MKKQNISSTINYLPALSGTIDYPLTNDYMFRSVMQSNKNVLKGLLCSLLRLNSNDIHSVEILNPIELGKTIIPVMITKTQNPHSKSVFSISLHFLNTRNSMPLINL